MATNDYHLIQQYAAGLLSPEEMHELEKKALEDPFLSDALEGYSYTSPAPGRQLSILQHQLEERIARQQADKNRFNFSWQRLSVAAAAALIFILGGILFWMKMSMSTKHKAKETNIETILTPNALQTAEPEPVAGWQAYEEYLNTHTRLPSGKNITGQVILSFSINPDGSVDNVDVIKSLSPEYDAEAIRLVKEGPKWKSDDSGDVALLTLDFSG